MFNCVIKASKVIFIGLVFSVLLTACNDTGDSAVAPPTGSSETQTASVNSAQLSWSVPFTRVNGDSIKMGELSGYVIRYGQAPNALTESLHVQDAHVTRKEVAGLSTGDWYFAVQAVDTEGLVSAPSATVSKSI